MIASSALLLCLIGGSAVASKLPGQFPKCHRNDPQLNDCLLKAVEASIPHLTKGVPSLGLIPLDPLRVTYLEIKQGNGPVAVDMKFRDLDFINLSHVKLNKVTADVENYEIQLDVSLDEPLLLNGDYEINGKILVLPVNGKGKTNIRLDNLKAVLSLKGKELVRNGQTYMDLTDVKLSFQTSQLHTHFENLSHEKEIGNNINKFMNENWKEILQELQPAFEEALGATFKEIARRLFAKVPYDEVFLR